MGSAFGYWVPVGVVVDKIRNLPGLPGSTGTIAINKSDVNGPYP
jgi:hypothetical protein